MYFLRRYRLNSHLYCPHVKGSEDKLAKLKKNELHNSFENFGRSSPCDYMHNLLNISLFYMAHMFDRECVWPTIKEC